MTRFLTARAAGYAGLRTAEVFGPRQFIAGVINHFIRLQLRWRVGAELVNLSRKNDDDKQQERLQQPRSQHAPVGKNAVRSFSRQAPAGAGKCRADGGDKLFPPRGPLDQQLRRVVKFYDRDFFELESFDQSVNVFRGLEGR